MHILIDDSKICSGKFEITFPSGRTFSKRGVYRLQSFPNGWTIPTITTAHCLIILDQRSVITLDGERIYAPWDNFDGLCEDSKSWLAENADHPAAGGGNG